MKRFSSRRGAVTLRSRQKPPSRNVTQTTLAASFTDLLQWLDSDPERAAEKYETIRNRLITVLASRGFGNPEQLADDTFDRVASKAAQLIEIYIGTTESN